MNVRLACLEVWTPAAVRRHVLDELAAKVAGAFGSRPPSWPSRRYRDRLAEFARFTDAEARRVLSEADATSHARTAEALRAAATDLGASLRRRLGVRSEPEGRRALRLLYRHIGIDLDAAADGRVRVLHCLFADYYSPAVCALIGSVDDGVARGLVGSSLTFSERLTDGAGECRGSLTGRAS